jgi:hypothetical protein
MDDYLSNVLSDSKNEWSILFMNYISPHIIDGFRSIFNEAVALCDKNDEMDKYLMTFQNLLTRIRDWNQQIIEKEKERIVSLCKCTYLEELLTCVHIIQLKILSSVRVGSENKKITINVPDFASFLHQVYINVARKLYTNIYLFEIEIPDLEIQKRNREVELIVQTCIMNTIRERMPIEELLRQYIDETQEVDVKKVETIVDTKPMEVSPKVELQKMNESSNTNVVLPSLSTSESAPIINTLPEPSTLNNMNIEQEKSSTIKFANQLESFSEAPAFRDSSEDLELGEAVELDGFDDLDMSNHNEVSEKELGIIEL